MVLENYLGYKMKKYEEISIYNIKVLKKYFKENSIIAYGNGEFYKRVKNFIKEFDLEFSDILYTENSKIVSISGRKYEDIVENSYIIICSSFYEDIIKNLENQEIQAKSIKVMTFKDNVYNKEYLVKFMSKKHKLFIDNLKDKNKIKVVFLAIHRSIWKVDKIFKEMLINPYFEPIILICPHIVYGDERMWEDMQNSIEYFKEKGYPFVSSYNQEENRWVTLKEIQPDIVFFTNPHSLTKEEYYQNAFLNYLSCYAGYGILTANYNSGQSQYNQIFHNTMWKIFVQNKDMLDGYKRLSSLSNKNIHLVIDNIIEVIRNKSIAKIVWKNYFTHKKVIWAPHHTIIKNFEAQLSTFLIYADFMRELALKTKDTITWAFKPHPILKPKLYNHPKWGIEKTDEYYKFWQDSSNTQLEDGEYIELFKQSDALINDSASFLVEYIFTNNPMLYLMTDYTKDNLNKFGNKCLNLVEQAFNKDDIKSFLDLILENKFKESKKINKFIQDYFNDLGKNINSSAIINFIKNDIGGKN